MPTAESSALSPPASPALRIDRPVLDALDEAVGKLRFGVVQLTVHDGRVVQLDITEKHRF